MCTGPFACPLYNTHTHTHTHTLLLFKIITGPFASPCGSNPLPENRERRGEEGRGGER